MKQNTKNLVLAALFVALGLVLPFFTGQIPQIGGMLLPMHLPVLICGLLCGWQYGAVVGLILPMLRYFLFGMPPVLTAIAMSFEMLAYGLVVGLLYSRSRFKCIFSLYRSLITAMVAGRLVWGAVRVILTGVAGEPFTWQLFISGALLTAIPGIILQLVFIPALMVALDKTGLVRFTRKKAEAAQP
nr:ECF transporter S component [uncultured Agathobaculum sp.]